MSELVTIKELAKEVLTKSKDSLQLGRYLWERTQRMVRHIEYICELPEIAQPGLEIDRFSLLCATYFSETGLSGLLGRKNAPITYPFFKSGSDGLMELCAQIIDSKLGSILTKSQVVKIKKIISESVGHSTSMTEAMILSDARNLEDMGAVGLFNELKRFMSQGKNISDILLHWQKQIDYRYWQARLEDNFWFEDVRKLAEQRLATAWKFMNQLQTEAEARDLKALKESFQEPY